MEKGYTRIIVAVLAALIFGSSAVAMQWLPTANAVVQANETTYQGAEEIPSDINNHSDAELALEQAKTQHTAVQESEQELEDQDDQEANDPADANTAAENMDKPASAEPDMSVPLDEEETEDQAESQSEAKPEIQAEAVQTEQIQTTEKVTPANPYQLGSARDHGFLSEVVVKNTGSETSKNVRVQIPLVTANSLYFNRKGESFSIEPAEIISVNGTRVGVFSLGDIAPGENVTVSIHTQVQTSVIKFDADYQPADGNVINEYLNASSGIESTNGQIISLSEELTATLASDWDKADAITRWVAVNIKYNASALTRNSGALAALQNRTGVCEDYAALSAALARAAGIPARIVYGYTDNGNKWPGSSIFSLSGYRHAWVEYNLAGRGWVPADPTRSNSSTLYFGTLPHNRYIIQNYSNQSLKGYFSGGKISVNWADSLE